MVPTCMTIASVLIVSMMLHCRRPSFSTSSSSRSHCAPYLPCTRPPAQRGRSRQSPRETSQAQRRRPTHSTSSRMTCHRFWVVRVSPGAFVRGKKKRPQALMAQGRHCPRRRAFKPVEKRLCFPTYFVGAFSIPTLKLSTGFLLQLYHHLYHRAIPFLLLETALKALPLADHSDTLYCLRKTRGALRCLCAERGRIE